MKYLQYTKDTLTKNVKLLNQYGGDWSIRFDDNDNIFIDKYDDKVVIIEPGRKMFFNSYDYLYKDEIDLLFRALQIFTWDIMENYEVEEEWKGGYMDIDQGYVLVAFKKVGDDIKEIPLESYYSFEGAYKAREVLNEIISDDVTIFISSRRY